MEAAYDADAVSLHARINVRMPDGKTYRTTPGRVLVSNILPKEMSFENVNLVLTKKMIAKLVENCYRQCGIKATVILCDNLKIMGYEFATRAGVSIGVKDLIIPARKKDILAASQAEVDDIERQYRDGIITRTEKYNKVVDVWTKATQDVSTEMIKEISYDILKDPKTGRKEKNQSFNSIFMMSTSGARGNQDQMRQLAGMRGLMAKPSGEIIETPITSSFREGLSVLQYFTSTHGARKGLADTALKTANSGYLTRRLVDVVQDVIVSEHDCGTVDGIELTHLREGGDIKTPVWERAMGRVLLYPVYDPEDAEKVLLPENTPIDEAEAAVLREHGVSSITVRSPLTCQAGRGICALCYGRDLARGHLVNTGETVGIIAAQYFKAVGIYWYDGCAIVHTDTRDAKATWLCDAPRHYPSTTYQKFILPTIRRGCTGDANRAATKMLQRLLGLTPDGIFGEGTENALLKAQEAHGLTVDGIDYRDAAGDPTPAPADAASLYREARQGMSNSDFNNVTLLLPAGSGLTQAAEEINGEWQKQFSLFFSLEEVEPEEFEKRLAEGNYTIALAPISVYNVLAQFTAQGGGLTGYANSLYATQLAASSTATGSARCSLLADCERQLLSDCAVVPLFSQQKRLLIASGIQGLVFDPFGPVLDLT